LQFLPFKAAGPLEGASKGIQSIVIPKQCIKPHFGAVLLSPIRSYGHEDSAWLEELIIIHS